VCHQRNKRGIKKFLESSENENTAYQKLWNIAKVVLSGKLIAMGIFIKKSERSQIINLMMYPKLTEK
jgi:hypothetical protein